MTSASRPCVAVLIAAYNAEETIGRAVASALAQPEVAEVCVVDDVSTDATVRAAKGADDGSKRLRVIQQPANRGPAAARNRAMDSTKAEYLAVLDADDFLLPGRMAGLLAYRDRAEFIGDDLLRAFEGREEDSPEAAWKLSAVIEVDFATFVERNVPRQGAARAELGFLKPLMSRAFLERHSLRYREELRLGEDFDLYARALALGARMVVAPAQGYVSVVRGDSLSAKHSELDLIRLRDASALLARVRPMSPTEAKALRRHYASCDCKIEWLRLIEAVKARNAQQMVRPFFRSHPIPVYLLARLWEQFLERGLKFRDKP